ncbi:MAG TPA: hypothetical protein PLW65_16050, partial [Pseudomonadota bacterium]|nr:hypothetical protein [Pseudomonadota bacterium]
MLGTLYSVGELRGRRCRRAARHLSLGCWLALVLPGLGLGMVPTAQAGGAAARPKKLSPMLQHVRQGVTAFHAGDYAAVRSELLPLFTSGA